MFLLTPCEILSTEFAFCAFNETSSQQVNIPGPYEQMKNEIYN